MIARIIKKAKQQLFALVYLSSLIFIGIFYLSITPIFEGFDEVAHYSSMRQVADTGTIPLYGKSYIDQFVIDIRAPIHYQMDRLPFDNEMVYKNFFKHPELVERYQIKYRQALPIPDYRPSTAANYQAQHPPLYYLLLAPVTTIVDQFSFTDQIFLVRFVSFLLAILGIVLALLAVNQSKEISDVDPRMIGFLCYPIMLPMFFPEFARMGNDSLCLFLVGLLAYFLSLWFKDEESVKKSIAIGVTLGMGLLTKALFLPIVSGLAVFLFIRCSLDKQNRIRRLWGLAYIFLPALFIGGSWYVYKWIMFGDFTGSDDGIVLARQGGLFEGLKNNFSIYWFLRGLLLPFTSYTWSGTMSMGHLPAFLQFPLVLLAFWVFVASAQQLKKEPYGHVNWLPVWVFGFFVASLFWHVVLSMALRGKGGTPGWYLHILMPWVAPFIGWGIVAIFRDSKARWFLIGFLLYAVLFQLMSLWGQFALFTGCASKALNGDYVFPDHFFCLDQTPLLIDRLAVLGYPALAVVGLVGGVLTNVWLFRHAWKQRALINHNT